SDAGPAYERDWRQGDDPRRPGSVAAEHHIRLCGSHTLRARQNLIRDPLGPFRKVGAWTYFVRDIGRALGDVRTYGSETIRQMRNIGVDSVPLAAIVAAFIGAVTAIQTRYQLFGGVQLSVVGVVRAMATAVTATDVASADCAAGLRLSFTPFQIVYSVIKATIFGGAIAFSRSYEGYAANVGAEGVGRSTAQAVVVTSVAILVLDALTALLLAPYLQA